MFRRSHIAKVWSIFIVAFRYAALSAISCSAGAALAFLVSSSSNRLRRCCWSPWMISFIASCRFFIFGRALRVRVKPVLLIRRHRASAIVAIAAGCVERSSLPPFDWPGVWIRPGENMDDAGRCVRVFARSDAHPVQVLVSHLHRGVPADKGSMGACDLRARSGALATDGP